MAYHRLLSASLVAAFALPSVALAQDAGDGNKTEDIVVTGEKTNRSLQDTTTSVSVTTERRIAEENLLTVQQIYQRTANVSETYGANGFSIRGIDQRGVSGGGDAATATVFVDGAPVPQAILSSGPTDMWDVAQVEIFRGPQSTIQGLNALAGAVHIRTQDPTFDWRVKARSLVSSFSTTQFAVAGGGPIVKDQLAFRLSAEKRDSAGFIRNVTRNTSEDPLNLFSLRGKLLWKPAALPGLEARLSYQHFRSKSGYIFAYVDRSVPDYFDNRTNPSDYPDRSDFTSELATWDLRYDLGGGLSLTALGTWNDTDFMRQYDGDFTAKPIAQGRVTGGADTVTQELRANYEGTRLSGLIGLFYYNRGEERKARQVTLVPTPQATIARRLAGALGAATAERVATLYAAALPNMPVDYSSDFPSHVETMAVFGDGRFRLTRRFSLLGGFRFDHERNRTGGEAIASFVGTLPDPAAYGRFAPVFAAVNAAVLGLVRDASGGAPQGTRSFNAFLPKGGVEMAWTPDLSTAFVVQRGYRSGGSSFNTARSQLFAYNPEFTWNYELSVRSAWLDGRLTANANIYYVDWRDQQTLANFGNGVYDSNTVNAGKSHLFGFELELAHRVSSLVDWYASVGHTRTRFDRFVTRVGSITDLSGLEFPYAPHWTLAGGVNLRLHGGFSANLNASYRSAVYAGVEIPQSAQRLAPRTLVNARIGYTYGPWRLSLFANNLLDEHYDQYVNARNNFAIIGAPRSVGVMAEIGF